MKKLTGIVATSFMAGMLCFGIGERVAEEVWASKTALADNHDKWDFDYCLKHSTACRLCFERYGI